jgi:hypothetical protein
MGPAAQQHMIYSPERTSCIMIGLKNQPRWALKMHRGMGPTAQHMIYVSAETDFSSLKISL